MENMDLNSLIENAQTYLESHEYDITIEYIQSNIKENLNISKDKNKLEDLLGILIKAEKKKIDKIIENLNCHICDKSDSEVIRDMKQINSCIEHKIEIHTYEDSVSNEIVYYINGRINSLIKNYDLNNVVYFYETITNNKSCKPQEVLTNNLLNKISSKLVSEINVLTKDFYIEEANNLYNDYNKFLSDPIKERIIENINSSKNNKINKLKKECFECIKKEMTVRASEILQEIKRIDPEQHKLIKKEADELRIQQKEEEDYINFQNKCNDVEKYLKSLDISNAEISFQSIKDSKLGENHPEKIDELEKKIKNLKLSLKEEDATRGKQPICSGFSFNIPKKEDFGEDADPYCNISDNRNWGIISVYDGMGGAGGRKYKHKKTGEEHTSAWWASRFVREAVEKLIVNRPLGKDPVKYMDENLHECIKKKLDTEIDNFPNAQSNLISKMIKKLPTTMALCLYQIKENNINIYCYWSGDSRIYLFDSNQNYFLTIDDVNAENNDPFSPINDDLAMNNTISQGIDFKIHKSFLEIPLTNNNPLFLIAATDGCFGYYPNPIAFEYMIRKNIISSENEKDLNQKIQKSIIDNIQQDDFSMGAVILGVNSYKEFKKTFTKSIEKSIFTDYDKWEEEKNKKITNIQTKIDQAGIEKSEIKQKQDIQNKRLEKINSISNNIKNLLSEMDEICEVTLSDKFSNEINPILEKENANKEDLDRKFKELDQLIKTKEGELANLLIDNAQNNNYWYEEYKKQNTIIPNDCIYEI